MTKVVVITGATSGIGEATALFLKDKGYCVYSLARRVKDIEGINYLSCDVTDKEAIATALATIYQKEGSIFALINNAGIGIGGAFETTDEEEVRKILAVNLEGSLNASQLVIPYLKKSQGRIINIGSIAGEIPIPFQAHYSLTKAGLAMFSQTLALELKPLGIKVSCVLPGDTKTSFTSNRVKQMASEDYGERISRSLKRMEKDEENGVEPIKVSKVIYKCLTKKNPPVKVAVGFGYKCICLLNRLLPTRFVNWVVYRLYAK